MKHIIRLLLVFVVLLSLYFYKDMKRKQLAFYSITCGQGDDEQSFRSVKKISENYYEVSDIGVINTSECKVKEVKP